MNGAGRHPITLTGLLLGLALGFVALAVIPAAALWSSGGSGTGRAATGTLTAPGAPSATLTAAGAAQVSWTAASVTGGGEITYLVERSADAGSSWAQACGGAVTGALSCTDTVAPGTSLRYRVRAVFNSWTAQGQVGATLVVPGTAVALRLTVADSTVAGSVLPLTVTAVDSQGRVASGYRGTIHLTSSDPHSTLPADVTFTAADGGTHAYPTGQGGVTLVTAGSRTLTATDVDSGIGATATIQVTPGPATVLRLASGTEAPGAGVPFSVTVTAEDAYGNVATDYRGTVRFSSDDARASLPPDRTFTGQDRGAVTVGITLRTPGRVTVTAADTVVDTRRGSLVFAVADASPSPSPSPTPSPTRSPTPTPTAAPPTPAPTRGPSSAPATTRPPSTRAVPSSPAGVRSSASERRASVLVLNIAGSPPQAGAPVTILAGITPTTATGTVTFSESGVVLGACQLGGPCQVTVPGFSAGRHEISATYPGDARTLGSQAVLALDIPRAASTVMLTRGSGGGSATTFMVTVAPTRATGVVSVLEGGVALGSCPLTAGSCRITVADLAPGPHRITATYGGDALIAGSTSAPLSLDLPAPVVRKPGPTGPQGWRAALAAPTMLSSSVLRASQVLTNPVAVTGAIAAGLVCVLLGALPAQLVAHSLNGQLNMRRRGLRPLPAWWVRAARWWDGVAAWLDGHRRAGAVLMVVCVAVLSGFADPGFGFRLSSVRTVLAFCIALTLSSIGSTVATGWVSRRRWKSGIRIDLRPWTLGITALGVVASRLLLAPTFLFGLLVGMVFLQRADFNLRSRARVLRTAMVLVGALVCWFGYDALLALTPNSPGFGTSLVRDSLGALATQGIAGLAIAMLPLRMLDGNDVWRHRRWQWAATYTAVLALFFLVLVPMPQSWRYLGRSFLPWTIGLALFTVAALLLYWATVRRSRLLGIHEVADLPPDERPDEPPAPGA